MSKGHSHKNLGAIHREVIGKIIASIEKNPENWQPPWRGRNRRPTNVISEIPYQNENSLILMMKAKERGFASGIWGTRIQWANLHVSVPDEEEGTYIVRFWTRNNTHHSDNNTKPTPRFSTFEVFAAEQVRGRVPERIHKFLLNPIKEAEYFVGDTGAIITHDGKGEEPACYYPDWYSPPLKDSIQLPQRNRFIPANKGTATDSYYATLFHELTHWTSKRTRCNRPLGMNQNDPVRAMEELIAELGAAFLCADLDITCEPIQSHASYISSWLQCFKDDVGALASAAREAEKS